MRTDRDKCDYQREREDPWSLVDSSREHGKLGKPALPNNKGSQQNHAEKKRDEHVNGRPRVDVAAPLEPSH